MPPDPLCAIGCSIDMDLLAAISVVSDAFNHSPTPSSLSTCIALVCSSKASFVREKLSLIRQLWNANISSDILHDPVENVDQLIVSDIVHDIDSCL